MSEHITFAPIDLDLRDHRHVRIREIRLDDLDELRQAFGRLSRESRYTRFMSSIKELSPEMLDRAVHLRTAREVCLVAETDAPDGIDIVGGARYYVLANGDDCEFAVTVVDGWQGAGLASRLMRELIKAARERGLKQMEGSVLAGNTAMLDLARRLGFSVKADPHDAAVKIVRLDLTSGTTPRGTTPS